MQQWEIDILTYSFSHFFCRNIQLVLLMDTILHLQALNSREISDMIRLIMPSPRPDSQNGGPVPARKHRNPRATNKTEKKYSFPGFSIEILIPYVRLPPC